MPETDEVIEGEVVEVDEEIRNLPALRASEAVVARGEISVDELVAQAEKIKQVMGRAMKSGVHYGLIPGINKPTLLKPGAEMLNVLLRLSPSYKSEKVFGEGGHLTVISSCTLTHIPTGLVIAQGEGLCSTREAKYAYRQGGRTCPVCGVIGSIKRSKYPPRSSDYPLANPADPPGWYCHNKVGGCGQKFAFNDEVIASQPDIARIDNPDLPDSWNTILKMSDKRALIAAVLNGTGASDVFTQDVEEAGTVAADVGEIENEPEQTPREVDPGRDLLPNALKGADAAVLKEIDTQMKGMNPSIDWRALIGYSCAAQFKVKTRAELSTDQKTEWWLRLRNAIAKLAEISAEFSGELAASPEQVAVAFKWAFPEWEGEVQMLSEESKPEPTPEHDSDSEPAPLTAMELNEAAAAAEAAGVDVPFPDATP